MGMEIARAGQMQTAQRIGGATPTQADRPKEEVSEQPAAARFDRVDLSPEGRRAARWEQAYKGLEQAFSGEDREALATALRQVQDLLAEEHRTENDPDGQRFAAAFGVSVLEQYEKRESAGLAFHEVFERARRSAEEAAAAPEEEKQKPAAPAEEPGKEKSEGEMGGKVVFNAEKRARQLASAKTPEQVRKVLALLREDLQECQAGVVKGWCSEDEVAKVQAMIQRAQGRLAQVAGNEDEEQPGLTAFDLNMLM